MSSSYASNHPSSARRVALGSAQHVDHFHHSDLDMPSNWTGRTERLVSGSVSQVAVNLHRDDHQVEEARKSFELGAASPSAPPVYRNISKKFVTSSMDNMNYEVYGKDSTGVAQKQFHMQVSTSTADAGLSWNDEEKRVRRTIPSKPDNESSDQPSSTSGSCRIQ
eukprot:CAMPEP_0114249684 /NCGR_PEP_ID=MMETSP0058-20121206/14284_1 /TAXON_ID=36894 /ORGANISM="Pyramimonas parkeae, CCMP726" /LENGTH=164 /DNA_ID=CAMNT_0001363267 /DNA_START=289 /DNA_END=783 /DNA_ORIENTATION=-